MRGRCLPCNRRSPDSLRRYQARRLLQGILQLRSAVLPGNNVHEPQNISTIQGGRPAKPGLPLLVCGHGASVRLLRVPCCGWAGVQPVAEHFRRINGARSWAGKEFFLYFKDASFPHGTQLPVMRAFSYRLRRGIHGADLIDIGIRVGGDDGLLVEANQLAGRVHHIDAPRGIDEVVDDIALSGCQQIGRTCLEKDAHRRFCGVAVAQGGQTPSPLTDQIGGFHLASHKAAERQGDRIQILKGVELKGQDGNAQFTQVFRLVPRFLASLHLQNDVRFLGYDELGIGLHMGADSREIGQFGQMLVGSCAGYDDFSCIQRQQNLIERAVKGNDPACGDGEAFSVL